MFFNGSTGGGFGATPYGTFFGSGFTGLWGLFTGTFKTSTLSVTCESCSRLRSSKNLGGITPFGGFESDGKVYIVAADVVPPATCFYLRFDGPSGQSFTAPLKLLPGVSPPPVIAPAPPITAPSPPPGAVLADDLLVADAPEVTETGTYLVTLVDQCCDCEQPMFSLLLESPPMIITPIDADLGGAPRAWLYGHSGNPSSSQPASGSRVSVPFDKCQVVVEYDARFGTLPSSQGFTHAGSGSPSDYVLVEGGALRGVTVSKSFWTKTVVVSADPGSAFIYMQARDITVPYSIAGSGLDFQALFAPAISSAYLGVRGSLSADTWRATHLDGSTDQALSIAAPFGPAKPDGWTSFAFGKVEASGHELGWDQHIAARFASTMFGSTGSAIALNVIAKFGDSEGGGIDALVRNFVASFGGRFIRPWFTSYTQTTAPILRLYMTSDIGLSSDKRARFRVLYGQGTGDPYATPPLSVEQTINFTVANQTYETPLTLSGLTANLPFWFTVERVWDSGEDINDATVHLLQATVRAV